MRCSVFSGFGIQETYFFKIRDAGNTFFRIRDAGNIFFWIRDAGNICAERAVSGDVHGFDPSVLPDIAWIFVHSGLHCRTYIHCGGDRKRYTIITAEAICSASLYNRLRRGPPFVFFSYLLFHGPQSVFSCLKSIPGLFLPACSCQKPKTRMFPSLRCRVEHAGFFYPESFRGLYFRWLILGVRR